MDEKRGKGIWQLRSVEAKGVVAGEVANCGQQPFLCMAPSVGDPLDWCESAVRHRSRRLTSNHPAYLNGGLMIGDSEGMMSEEQLGKFGATRGNLWCANSSALVVELALVLTMHFLKAVHNVRKVHLHCFVKPPISAEWRSRNPAVKDTSE